jgi:hypothetical protein
MIVFTEGTRSRISVDECTIEGIHTTEIQFTDGLATVICPCCQGEGEHQYGRGPYSDTYQCDSCKGVGYFSVNL